MEPFTSSPAIYHSLVDQGEAVGLSRDGPMIPGLEMVRDALERMALGSALFIPIFVGGRVTHLMVLLGSDERFARWSEDYAHRVRLVGEILAKALISRSRQEALAKSQKVLATAQRIAHVGSLEWDITTGNVQCSDETYRIFGLEPQQFPVTYDAFLGMVHPEDRRMIEEAARESLTGSRTEEGLEVRILLPDGDERTVFMRGEVAFDRERKPTGVIGTVLDITGRKQTEKALRKAFDEIKKLKDRLEAENIYLRDEIELKEGPGDIIGKSDVIQYVMYRARQVAPTKTTVLLTGETGTGKGLFARFIHRESDRKDKPFVNVNCAGLPANLIESELFGREKGAYTGSTARQIGRFELANNGTIFLDEIGELPLELQAKLLRVIEDGEFERLGSPHSVKVNVRIIASTNRNLEEEIRKGRFREDLFFRLNVFPITIPPLRHRTGDILLLVKSFVQKFNRTYGKDVRRIPATTMESLENYSWPGNVRELMNVLERAVIVCDGPDLRLAENIIAPPVDAVPVDAVPEELSKGRSAPETMSLAEAEWEYVLEALHKTGWRIEGPRGAALLLGLHPNTLRSRMKKLGIKRPGK